MTRKITVVGLCALVLFIVVAYRVPLERGLYIIISQVLPDDPRDDTHGYAAFHIQAGNGKGHIILLPGHPVVIAGVRHRIDSVSKPDIDDALMDISDLASVLALDAALLQIVPVGVFSRTLDVGPDAQVFRALTPHTGMRTSTSSPTAKRS